jgi:hypothetical protein
MSYFLNAPASSAVNRGACNKETVETATLTILNGVSAEKVQVNGEGKKTARVIMIVQGFIIVQTVGKMICPIDFGLGSSGFARGGKSSRTSAARHRHRKATHRANPQGTICLMNRCSAPKAHCGSGTRADKDERR